MGEGQSTHTVRLGDVHLDRWVILHFEEESRAALVCGAEQNGSVQVDYQNGAAEVEADTPCTPLIPATPAALMAEEMEAALRTLCAIKQRKRNSEIVPRHITDIAWIDADALLSRLDANGGAS